jgi:hypothetical protein
MPDENAVFAQPLKGRFAGKRFVPDKDEVRA